MMHDLFAVNQGGNEMIGQPLYPNK